MTCGTGITVTQNIDVLAEQDYTRFYNILINFNPTFNTFFKLDEQWFQLGARLKTGH